MNTVEALVYLVFALILGSAVYLLIANWNYMSSYIGLKSVVVDNPLGSNVSFKRVSLEELVGLTRDLMVDCSSRVGNRSFTVLVEGSGNLSGERFFGVVKNISWCATLKSVDFDCGDDINVNVSLIPLPAVVSVKCTDGFISIDS